MGKPTFWYTDVVGQASVGGVEVLVLQGVQERLDRARVVECLAGFSSEVCSVMAPSLVAGRCGTVGAMRVAVVAGPDPGHAFPAIALCLKFLAAGDAPTLLTGTEWLDTARAAGVDAVELLGLDPTERRRRHRFRGQDSPAGRADGGAQRAGLRELAPDLVVSDVITACGGMAAELMGVPWVELSPHPLYRPSKGLPPLGSGLAPGIGVRGRLRDAVMRALTARSWREGLRQRSAARVEIGLPAVDPGPLRRLIATLPALEVPRPDWPARGRRRGAAALRTDVVGASDSGGCRAGGGRGAVDGDDRARVAWSSSRWRR